MAKVIFSLHFSEHISYGLQLLLCILLCFLPITLSKSLPETPCTWIICLPADAERAPWALNPGLAWYDCGSRGNGPGNHIPPDTTKADLLIPSWGGYLEPAEKCSSPCHLSALIEGNQFWTFQLNKILNLVAQITPKCQGQEQTPACLEFGQTESMSHLHPAHSKYAIPIY